MATIKMVIQLRRASTAEWLANKDIKPAQGEPCFDYELNTLKIGDGVKTYEQLEPIGGASVSADGKSIVLTDGVFKLAGFDAAEVGAQLRKGENGLEWVVPTGATVEEMQTIVGDLQADVADLQELVGVPADGSGTLLSRIEGLETKMDGTGEGTVDEKIDAKINEFANKISDDGVVNTLKELIDYVADHGSEVADMAADITSLQGLVGDTKVSVQIETAVSGLVKAEAGKGLSTNDFTDSLLEKLDGIDPCRARQF